MVLRDERKSYALTSFMIPDLRDFLSDDVHDRWWFRYFARAMTCARARILQTNGTCWFNSVFNMLIMNPRIRGLLTAELGRAYASEKARQSLSDYHEMLKENSVCPHPTRLKDALFGLLQDISSNRRMDDDDRLAGRVWEDQMSDSRTVINSIATGISRRTEQGHTDMSEVVERIMAVMLPDVFSVVKAGVFADIPKLLAAVRRPGSVVLVAFEKVVYRGSLPLQVAGFQLVGALLLNAGHAVAGSICNGQQFVYDSNNYIAYTRWADLDLTGLYDMHYEQVLIPHEVNPFGCTVALYTRT